jgi:hypothetical protein
VAKDKLTSFSQAKKARLTTDQSSSKSHKLTKITEEALEQLEAFKNKPIHDTLPSMVYGDNIVLEFFQYKAPPKKGSSILVPGVNASYEDYDSYDLKSKVIDSKLFPIARVLIVGSGVTDSEKVKLKPGDLVRIDHDLIALNKNPAYDEFVAKSKERPDPTVGQQVPPQYIMKLHTRMFDFARFPIDPFYAYEEDILVFRLPSTYVISSYK